MMRVWHSVTLLICYDVLLRCSIVIATIVAVVWAQYVILAVGDGMGVERYLAIGFLLLNFNFLFR